MNLSKETKDTPTEDKDKDKETLMMEIDLTPPEETVVSEYPATKGHYFRPFLTKDGKLKNEGNLKSIEKIERRGYFLLPKVKKIMGRDNFTKAMVGFLESLNQHYEKEIKKAKS